VTKTKPRLTGRRGEERDARIDWILDAALEIVVAEGLGALTTPRLAKQIGYTPAAFYRYFDSKDALLLALETRTAERFYARFFAAFAEARRAARSPRTPKVLALTEIVLLARTYAAVAAEEPKRFRLVSALVTGDRSWMRGESEDRLREQFRPRIIEVIGYFVEAENVGALTRGDAVRRAMTLWVALHAILAAAPMAAAHGDLLDLEGMREELLRTMLVGWGAAPKDVTAATDI
jgi:AcrR family transcriptional regulator